MDNSTLLPGIVAGRSASRCTPRGAGRGGGATPGATPRRLNAALQNNLLKASQTNDDSGDTVGHGKKSQAEASKGTSIVQKIKHATEHISSTLVDQYPGWEPAQEEARQNRARTRSLARHALKKESGRMCVVGNVDEVGHEKQLRGIQRSMEESCEVDEFGNMYWNPAEQRELVAETEKQLHTEDLTNILHDLSARWQATGVRDAALPTELDNLESFSNRVMETAEEDHDMIMDQLFSEHSKGTAKVGKCLEAALKLIEGLQDAAAARNDLKDTLTKEADLIIDDAKKKLLEDKKQATQALGARLLDPREGEELDEFPDNSAAIVKLKEDIRKAEKEVAALQADYETMQRRAKAFDATLRYLDMGCTEPITDELVVETMAELKGIMRHKVLAHMLRITEAKSGFVLVDKAFVDALEAKVLTMRQELSDLEVHLDTLPGEAGDEDSVQKHLDSFCKSASPSTIRAAPITDITVETAPRITSGLVKELRTVKKDVCMMMERLPPHEKLLLNAQDSFKKMATARGNLVEHIKYLRASVISETLSLENYRNKELEQEVIEAWAHEEERLCGHVEVLQARHEFASGIIDEGLEMSKLLHQQWKQWEDEAAKQLDTLGFDSQSSKDDEEEEEESGEKGRGEEEDEMEQGQGQNEEDEIDEEQEKELGSDARRERACTFWREALKNVTPRGANAGSISLDGETNKKPDLAGIESHDNALMMKMSLQVRRRFVEILQQRISEGTAADVKAQAARAAERKAEMYHEGPDEEPIDELEEEPLDELPLDEGKIQPDSTEATEEQDRALSTTPVSPQGIMKKRVKIKTRKNSTGATLTCTDEDMDQHSTSDPTSPLPHSPTQKGCGPKHARRRTTIAPRVHVQKSSQGRHSTSAAVPHSRAKTRISTPPDGKIAEEGDETNTTHGEGVQKDARQPSKSPGPAEEPQARKSPMALHSSRKCRTQPKAMTNIQREMLKSPDLGKSFNRESPSLARFSSRQHHGVKKAEEMRKDFVSISGEITDAVPGDLQHLQEENLRLERKANEAIGETYRLAEDIGCFPLQPSRCFLLNYTDKQKNTAKTRMEKLVKDRLTWWRKRQELKEDKDNCLSLVDFEAQAFQQAYDTLKKAAEPGE